jgi:threonine aldolase
MAIVDFRSDTVTLPTDEMRAAMRSAELGDDSRDGDPTVRALEALAAQRTGKESALFLPSGTMANLVALLAHTAGSGEVLLEENAHILRSELGGITTLAGLFPQRISGTRGAMDPLRLQRALKKPSRSSIGTVLICMETTHNAAGGAVLSLDHMSEIYRIAGENNIPVHTDGARLFNAAIALGVSAARIAQYSDSVCFCVSKGLSAPVGSLMAGPVDFIERARAFRRMVGGNMRQAGMLAAAGIVALERMVTRLAEDHANARAFADGLHRIDPRLVDPKVVETNIVRVDVGASGHDAVHWSARLHERGVLVSPAGASVLRFVTHRHINAGSVREAVGAFEEIWRARR